MPWIGRIAVNWHLSTCLTAHSSNAMQSIHKETLQYNAISWRQHSAMWNLIKSYMKSYIKTLCGCTQQHTIHSALMCKAILESLAKHRAQSKTQNTKQWKMSDLMLRPVRCIDHRKAQCNMDSWWDIIELIEFDNDEAVWYNSGDKLVHWWYIATLVMHWFIGVM